MTTREQYDDGHYSSGSSDKRERYRRGKPAKMSCDLQRDMEAAEYEYYSNDAWDHSEETEVRNVKPQQQNDGVDGECLVCGEVRPLVQLLKNCRHTSACAACLRTMYVVQAQQDVSKYPLKCSYPGCGLPVRDTQLRFHSLVRDEYEMAHHHQLLSRVYRHPDKKAEHCPRCDQAVSLAKTDQPLFKVFKCRRCRNTLAVDRADGVDEDTINAWRP